MHLNRQKMTETSDTCHAFRDGLKTILDDKLYGVYIYGAVVFPDTLPTGDIDFHVILKQSLTERERSTLYDLHDTLAREYPPMGGEFDGYYLLLEDARRKSPPTSQMWDNAVDHSWALHREHIRSGRCIVLFGPDPKEIYPATSWDEIEEALRGELKYVEDHLEEYPDYCILNLCRLMYSYETKDVVISKAASAEWASGRFPEWRHLIELARRSYAKQTTAQDRKYMLTEVNKLYGFACECIEESSSAGQDPRDPDKIKLI